MPSRPTLVRWGGLAAVVAGALYVLGALSAALDYPPGYIFTCLHLDAVWGVPLHLLIAGALVGLHSRQAGSRGYGRLGTAGFLLAFVGSLLVLTLGDFAVIQSPPWLGSSALNGGHGRHRSGERGGGVGDAAVGGGHPTRGCAAAAVEGVADGYIPPRQSY
jgi:hypothetical protein